MPSVLISEKIEKREGGYYKVRVFEEAILLSEEELDTRILALKNDLDRVQTDRDNLEAEKAKETV